MDISVMSVIKAYDVYSTGKSSTAGRGSRADEKKDTVSLSSQAKDFRTVHEAVMNTPDINTEKVNAIKSQIAANCYDVNARMVADKILSGI